MSTEPPLAGDRAVVRSLPAAHVSWKGAASQLSHSSALAAWVKHPTRPLGKSYPTAVLDSSKAACFQSFLKKEKAPEHFSEYQTPCLQLQCAVL